MQFYNTYVLLYLFCEEYMDTTKTLLIVQQRTQYLKAKIFSYLIMGKTSVNTISGSINLIEGSGRANILFPRETKFIITDALYSPKSHRNLLSFKDIRLNGYHIETSNMGNIEYLYITAVTSGNKHVLEKLPAFSFGLYYTYIRTI